MAGRHAQPEPTRMDNPFRMPPEMDLVWLYKPDDQKKTKALYAHLKQAEKSKIDFVGRIVKGKRFCLASFPGSYHREWEAYSTKCLVAGEWGSIASVFLNGKNFGEHSKNPEDGKRCYCHTLYGQEEPWGCQWFEMWAANIDEAIEDGQKLIVVSHSGQKDEGLVDWQDLKSKRGPLAGLSNSQKCEVAWLKKKGYKYKCVDITEWENFTEDLAKQERSKSIWERPTCASRYAATKTLKDAELPMAPVPPEFERKHNEIRGQVLESHVPDDTFLTTIATKPAIGVVEPLKREERDLRQYVSKKREVFLVQMALDVKKSEIERLDDQARMKEEALTKSQQMLDDDTRKFEEFLQERYSRAQRTTKEAENHAKEKQSKIAKIKGVKQQIASLQSEIGKFREVREECARYAAFLDYLTPLEWKEQQQDIKQSRKAKRRQEWISSRMAPILAKISEEERAIEKAREEDQPRERTFRKKGPANEADQAQRERERVKKQKALEKKKIDEERRVADQYEDVSTEEEPELFFKETRQLMDTFTELEEKNLSLIQSTQETEQMLDELTQNFEHNRKEMSTKVRQLNETIQNLQANISQEKRQCDMLQQRMAEKAGTESQDKKLSELQQKVRDVYLKCGLPDDHDPDILQMLGSIESKLEELIHGLDEAYQQDSETVMRFEKEKDKERRERVRVLRQTEQAREREERLANSLKRSQLPVFKKAGKQVMYRSPPLHREKKIVKDNTDDEAHARDHHVFGMYIHRKNGELHTNAPVVEETRQARTAARTATAGGSTGTFSGTVARDALAAVLMDGEDQIIDPTALALVGETAP